MDNTFVGRPAAGYYWWRVPAKTSRKSKGDGVVHVGVANVIDQEGSQNRTTDTMQRTHKHIYGIKLESTTTTNNSRLTYFYCSVEYILHVENCVESTAVAGSRPFDIKMNVW